MMCIFGSCAGTEDIIPLTEFDVTYETSIDNSHEIDEASLETGRHTCARTSRAATSAGYLF